MISLGIQTRSIVSGLGTACWHGHRDVVELLLNTLENVWKIDCPDGTPAECTRMVLNDNMDTVCSKNYLDIVDLLVSRGATKSFNYKKLKLKYKEFYEEYLSIRFPGIDENTRNNLLCKLMTVHQKNLFTG